MFSAFQLAKKYMHYWLTASNGKGHGIHSPFVFDFVKKVLNDSSRYAAYGPVEALRKQLKQDDTLLAIEDMGAGSSSMKQRQRKISDILRNAVKPKKYGQLLFRIIQFYKPAVVIELGTSLGLTTSYLAKGNAAARVITLEGAQAIAVVALNHFQQLSITNIELRQGNFDDTFIQVLDEFKIIDLAFIDGNHRRDATLEYFNMLSGKISSSSILIFDDIHWSAEMEEAWEIIKSSPLVTLSIDLFFIGLVFFRKDFKIKQHFIIRH